VRFLRSLLFLKLLALVTAIGLWYLVTSNRGSVSLTIPVEVRNIPPERVLLSSSVSQVILRLGGPSFLLGSVSTSVPAIRVTLPKAVPDKFIVPVQVSDIPLPPGFSVMGVEPPELELRFDDRTTAVVPVEVPRLGAIRDSLKIDEVLVQPQMVTVEGPHHQIRDVRQVETYPIDMREIASNTRLELALRKPSGLINVAVERVLVEIRVSPVIVTKEFPQLPIEVRGGEGITRFGIQPQTVRVVCSGPKDILANLQEHPVVALVRVSPGASVGDRIPVQIERPEGLTVTIEPDAVTVIPLTPSGAVTEGKLVEKPAKRRKVKN
jgi:YbbR domain-containing protein